MADTVERLTSILLDRYAIQRELGRGGMATVYLAEDQKHHRPVALKVLHPEIAAALGTERFLREIQLSARLTHPNILPLHDSGAADGLLYYVMPYVEGESLRDRLAREKQLPLEDAIQISREVADALSYAHAQGVIHRDIKPENILLEAGHAVVADFGIAKAIAAAGEQRLTETGLAVGTPAYMSPEQAAGSPDIDARSDLYSLGCVLFEMLGGETPYSGLTPQIILARKLQEPLPRIAVIRDSVPVPIQRALEKSLARTPADRFPTAGQFADAMRIALPSDEPRMRNGRRRARSAVAVTTAVMLLLAGSAVWIGWRLLNGPSLTITPSTDRQVTRDAALEIEPALSPDGREVAYTVDADGRWIVYIADVAGGRPFALTAELDGKEHHQPRWTADGQYVVVHARGVYRSLLMPRKGGVARPGPPGRVWATHGHRFAYQRGDSLFVGEASGRDETFVDAHEELHSAAWSSDGRWLAYVTGNLTDVAQTWGNVAPSAIRLADLERAVTRLLVDGGLNASPAWLPDSRSLLFVSNRAGRRDLYVLRLDRSGRPDQAPERLTTGLDPHSLSLSDDGTRMAYSRFRLRRNVHALEIPSTGIAMLAAATPVTTGNQVVENRAISADGQWMVFDSDMSGNQDIYVMRTAGGEPRRLTDNPADDFAPNFSPDGEEITFMSTRFGTRDIFVMNTDGTNLRRVTAIEPGEEYFPAFSPDGLRIVFALRQSQARSDVFDQLYEVSRASRSAPWSEPSALGRAGNRPSWSPDGRAFAHDAPQGIVVHRDGVARVLVDTAVTHLQRATRPTWSTDGRTVYFCADDANGWALFAVRADGGNLRPIVRGPRTYECGVAAAGRMFFSVGGRDSDVHVMDLVLRK